MKVKSSSFLARLTQGFRWGPSTPQVPSIGTGEIWYDSTGAHTEQDSALNVTVDLGASAPPGLISSVTFTSLSRGDNSTFIGGVGLKVITGDRSGVTAGNKGVLWGTYLSVRPNVARNNSPFDDADGLIIINDGTAKGTDALFIGQGAGFTGSQFANLIALGASADTLLLSNGTYTKGIDLSSATFSGNAFTSPGFGITNQGTVVASGLQSTEYLVTAGPTTLTGTSGTVSAGSPSVIFNPSNTFTATLPAATAGLWLWLKVIANFAVNSASSNVVPLAGGAAGTAILSGTAGKWAILQGDGTHFNIMAAN